MRYGWLAYLMTVFAFAWVQIDTPEPVRFESGDDSRPEITQTPIIQSEFISGGVTKEVHNATAVELPNGDIGAFWYAGEREGSADVAIYGRFLEKANNRWSEIHQIIDRLRSIDGLHRHIRKLGNSVAVYHRGELWLFYVTVSVGGWGGSSINLIRSSDQGETWSIPKRLVTSPFINISTLVKERPLISADGNILLPVYHEFVGKFAELLRLSPQGEVIDKYRITHGREAIQPLLIRLNEREALAFMRNTTESEHSAVLASRTGDRGSNWTRPSALELPNPNSAISGLSLDRPNELLLAFNNDSEQRTDLTLAYAQDYQTNKTGQWRIVHEFENRAGRRPGEEELHNPYSYPFLIKTSTGDFHIFYTWKRRYIKHVFFNRGALNEMLANERPVEVRLQKDSR